MIDRATQQIRTLSHLLHPPLLDEVGLLSALRWYLDGLTQRSGIETALEVQPSDFPRLAPNWRPRCSALFKKRLPMSSAIQGRRKPGSALCNGKASDRQGA